MDQANELPQASEQTEAGKSESEAPVIEPQAAKVPADDADQQPQEPHDDEPEDDEKLPKWAKKKMRNLERSLRHALKKQGGFEERLQSRAIQGDNGAETDDSESVSLSRQELRRLVIEEAQRLAPELKAQEAVAEARREVAEGLAREWGQEGFLRRSQDLEAAFDGLTDPKGVAKPAVDAIFEAGTAKDAARIIEYLADPDNADEAAKLSRMSAIKAAMHVAELKIKLNAKPAEVPQRSKAPEPVEAARGRGNPGLTYRPDMTDKQFAEWRRQQIKARGN